MAESRPTNPIEERKFEDRAFLLFEFTLPGSKTPVKFKLPFFENPQISETGAATYQKYDPIGRSGSLFSYTSSPARKINLTFTITPDHILETGIGVNPDKYILRSLIDNPEAAKKLVLSTKSPGEDEVREAVAGLKTNIEPYVRKFNDLTAKSVFEEFLDQGADVTNLSRYLTAVEQKKIDEKEIKVLTTLNWFINLVRASVKNNNEDTSYGPPIIRLTFGPMYNAVPCICLQHDIKIMDERGYDLKSLLPRGVQISMKLSELRTGEFKSFQPGTKNTQFHRDAISGWESIFKYGTFDSFEEGDN